jgi:hypothetical protein
MIAIIGKMVFGSIRTVEDHRIRALSPLCVLAGLCFCLGALLCIQSYVTSGEDIVEQGKTRSEEVISTARMPCEFTMARARMTFRTLLKAGRSQLDSTGLQSEPVIDPPSTACFSSIEILGNFRSQLFIFSAPGRSPPLS